MRVQVTEATFGESVSVQAALRAAGHDVTACHGDAGVCLARQSGSRCPLDAVAPVDLMVDVRGQEPKLRAREFGVVCALREHVPVVVVGVDPVVRPAVPAGLESRVAVATLDELLATCQYAVVSRAPRRPRSQGRPLPEEAW